MSHLLQLLIALAIILSAAKVAGSAAKHFGQPSVLGELLIGLVLGPTVLNMMHWSFLSHDDLMPIIKALSELGVILLMFLAGFETELSEMRKVGKAASFGAVGGVFLPLLGGTLVSLAVGLEFTEALFVGTILTATSVSISAQTLIEMGKIRSKEGTTILGAAVIDDIMGIVVLSVVVALEAKDSASQTSIPALLGSMVIFFVLALLASKTLPWLLRLVSKLQASESILTTALAICFLYSFAAEHIGHVAAITGAYAAGVALGQTEFKQQIIHKLESLTYSFFVPIFLVSIGLETNTRQIGQSIWFTIAIIVIAVVTKIAGSGIGVRLAGFNFIESIRVGVGMVSRGEVALIVSAVGLSSGLIGHDTFAVMIVMTLVTTLVTPMLLRIVFAEDGKKKETVRH